MKKEEVMRSQSQKDCFEMESYGNFHHLNFLKLFFSFLFKSMISYWIKENGF